MKRERLTEKEKEILNYIKREIKENKYPPTIREIGREVGLSSTATVHAYVVRLQDKGYIKKQDNKKRIIQLVKA